MLGAIVVSLGMLWQSARQPDRLSLVDRLTLAVVSPLQSGLASAGRGGVSLFDPWRHRFALVDWFLLGQLAVEVGYARPSATHPRLHQFTGTTPTAFLARPSPPTGDGGRQVNSVQEAVAAAS